MEDFSGGVPGIKDDVGEFDTFVDSILDEFFGKGNFAFKLMRAGLIFRDIGTEVDGEMFIFRDKAGSDGDVTVFFFTQGSAVLELSALGIFGVRFGCCGVIDG